LFFKQHRSEYYRLLNLVRAEGDWEAWLDFFLEDVEQTANNAVNTAKQLLSLFNHDEQRVREAQGKTPAALLVFSALCKRPLVSVKEVCRQTGLSFHTASKAIQKLKHMGIVREITGKRRNRIFAYQAYLDILNEGTEVT